MIVLTELEQYQKAHMNPTENLIARHQLFRDDLLLEYPEHRGKVEPY